MSRDARGRACRRCGDPILRGLSDDWCAAEVEVNPTPLNVFGEMLARIAHLGTYDLHREGDHLRLHSRDHWQIAGRPAGILVYCWRVDVLAEHRCGWVFPAAPSLLRSRTVSTGDLDGPPPF
jgi:hypothetical protein